MSQESSNSPDELRAIPSELKRCWDRLPNKLLFGLMFLGWVALFHFLGNSTLGYIKTTSLFGWMKYAFSMSDADELGAYMPLVVIGLAYWKRNELLEAAKAPWWPALCLVLLGLLTHWAGYVVQQTRLSIVGFFIGLYGILGMTWGFRFLVTAFFPFCLFVFCVPLATETERITFPMRLMATKITGVFCHYVMGIDVIADGTMLFDAKGKYQYEIAAACSGIKSLSATVAISIIAGFMFFKAPWRRLVTFLAAFPFAVLGNVLRLVAIIIASEAFGENAGKFVHDNSILSLLPYVPAIGGVVLLVKFLGDQELRKETPAQGVDPASAAGTASP
ncbi:MAG: exosortase/archaeosortase family protein [Verrucomicrobia bacterium]|nr:exosortase/archaeosortase family protein [Verrucomicrobiota bacterium]